MKTIAAVVDDIYEDLELWYPRLRLEEEGWKVVVAGPEARKVYTGKHGYPCRADIAFSDLSAADYEALLVPAVLRPTRSGAIRACSRWSGRCTPPPGSSGSSATPGGSSSPRASFAAGAPPARWASATTWSTPVPPGWTSRWWWTATWSAHGHRPTFPCLQKGWWTGFIRRAEAGHGPHGASQRRNRHEGAGRVVPYGGSAAGRAGALGASVTGSAQLQAQGAAEGMVRGE